jgi:hypothetical protein
MTDNVIHIKERRSHTVINVLEEMLTLAKSGELTGLAFAVKLGTWHASIGTCGDYTTNDVEALGAVSRLYSYVNRDAMCANCSLKKQTV